MEKTNTKNLVTMALLTAILYVGQITLSPVPNIEIVSLLVIIYTRLYKKKVFFIVYAFAILEGITFGFGIWWYGYLYIWSILAILVLLLKKQDSVALICGLSGAFGLAFGFLYAIPYFIVGGAAAGIAYWVAGIPYDITHCIGNVVLALALYKPIYMLLSKLVLEQNEFWGKDRCEKLTNKTAK